jgi:hypothetical protein
VRRMPVVPTARQHDHLKLIHDSIFVATLTP